MNAFEIMIITLMVIDTLLLFRIVLGLMLLVKQGMRK
jgi:hypothetical protein